MRQHTLPTAARSMTVALAFAGSLACTTGTRDDHPTSSVAPPAERAAPAPTAAPASVMMPPGTGMGGPTTQMLPTTGRVGSSLASDATVAAGDTLTVRLSAQSFDQVTEGGGLDLSFDPKVVQVVEVVPDAATWEFFTQSGRIDNTAGKVEGILFASFQGHRDSFPIATVTLRALAAGRPNLALSEANASPFASGGQRLAVQLQ
jgi:hypothetical protein